MNLIIEYFNPNDEQRRQEYRDCLKHNMANDLIEKNHAFISDNSELYLACEKNSNQPTRATAYLL